MKYAHFLIPKCNAVENKIILNLRLEVEDQKKMFFLMDLVLKKIEQLEGSDIQVEYFELRLHRQSYQSPTKESYMKIDANNRTFTDSEIARHWDEAIVNPCERLRQRFLGCNKTKGNSMPLFRSI